MMQPLHRYVCELSIIQSGCCEALSKVFIPLNGPARRPAHDACGCRFLLNPGRHVWFQVKFFVWSLEPLDQKGSELHGCLGILLVRL